MNINLIVAVDKHTFGIGSKGTIPWKNKNDMMWFKEVTTGSGNNAVIMGRTTYESIGKPLPNRLNIVLSHTDINIEGCTVSHSLDDAINIAKEAKKESAFIIGGASLYYEAISRDLVDIVYIDFIKTDMKPHEFDRFFDVSKILNMKYALSTMLMNKYKFIENTEIQVFYRMRTCNTVDLSYISLMNNVLTSGVEKHTRAGDTLSIFGDMLTFNLSDGLPILTTKKMYAKGCIHELIWFLKGDTNIKYLIENNTHIWDDDAYRYYLQLFENDVKPEDKMSKEAFIENVLEQNTRTFINTDNNIETYTYGDLGPVYGKQWTNWGGINQIKNLIHTLQTNPDDRRMLISAWNVSELENMALPPCHYMSQFYTIEMNHHNRCIEYARRTGTAVNTELTEEFLNDNNVPTRFLSCMWMQRSVDTCLGLPYDLLSYSILTHLIAKICNMVPWEIKCSLGDIHIYKNQIEEAKKQVNRNPFKYEYATLTINDRVNNAEVLENLTYDDIKIDNYKSYSGIKYKLSVGL